MKEPNSIGWAGAVFWLFMIIWLCLDYSLYTQGHETFFFKHKTPEELRIREAVIQKLENEAARGKPK